MKRLVLFVLLFFVTILYGAEEIGVWGWRRPAWKKFFKEEFSLDAGEIKAGEKGEVPVAEFKKYKLIILCQGGPSVPCTDEEISTITEYVKSGGKLFLFSGTPSGMFKGASAYDLSRAEEILGASTYFFGKGPAEILAPENPLVKEFTQKEYKWFEEAPGLSGITTAKVIVGKESAGKISARLLLNRYGKGFVAYLSPVAITSYSTGWKENPEQASLVYLLKSLITLSLQNRPSIEEVAGAVVERKPKRFDAISINGIPRDVTIFAEKESLAQATLLAKYLNKATGTDIQVNKENKGTNPLYIRVGGDEETKKRIPSLSSIHPFGYFITLADKNTLIIAGQRPIATEYAVYDFLKKFAGYRRFMPGDIGEILPEQKHISLPATLSLKEEPSLLSYVNAGFYGGSNFFRSWRTTLLASHWLMKIYPPEKYGKDHPEYYTMVDGKRFVPPANMGGTWQPCVTNPDLPAIAVEYAKNEWFPKNPEALGFSVGVNDGGGDCHCPDCTAAKIKYNNQYISYYNSVAKLLAKEVSNKLVCFIAYGGAAGVPKNITLEPNIYVEVCSGLQDNFQLMRGWKGAGAKHIGLYDYMYGGGYVVPRHYPSILGNAWKKAYREFGLSGAWTETFIQVWLYDGPRQYVMNELAWNINADINGLLDDYFTKFYAEAAVPMRQFFNKIEEVYGRKSDPLHPMKDWQSLAQFAEYRKEDLSFLDAKLAEAKKLVKDPSASKRLALFEKIFALSRLYLEGYLSTVDLKEITRITDESQAKKAMEIVSAGIGAAEKIDAYTMTPEEEKNIFINTTLNGFRNTPTLKIAPGIEQEADRIFSLINEWKKKSIGEKATREYWLSLATNPRYQNIAPILLTPVYCAESAEAKKNLVKSPGFEPDESSSDESVFTEKDLEKFEWKSLSKKLPGWSTWHFQQSVTRFYWDPTEAHSGKYSLAIKENQISGCFQTGIAVTPGCRYRLSFWVKQNPPDKGGSLSIRWSGPKGWADQGEGAVARILIPYPQEKESMWRKVETTFTVEANVTTCIPLFSAPRQDAGETIWFDDISMIKIYDPSFFPEIRSAK
jgi:hypothetical protein